jgi:hypothetical protein
MLSLQLTPDFCTLVSLNFGGSLYPRFSHIPSDAIPYQMELCVLQRMEAEFSNARMAKLADALASGASGREVVQVQVLFRAPEK